MTKPNKRRLKLAEMRDQAMESLGMEPGFELELDNGDVVVVPNPTLVPDDVQEKMSDPKQNPIDTARAVLGEENHKRLLAGGGHSNDIMLAWKLMSDEIAARDPKASK